MDFESYIQVGGIPSRNLLEEGGAPFTSFETDRRDLENWVWDKVFLNLEDFGSTFARSLAEGRANSVPNPYGPILLIVDPEALFQADDIAISLISAGVAGFDREENALELGDVERLFLKPEGPAIKWKDKLADEFGVDRRRISSPEMSCTIAEERIPWDHVVYVRTDPYSFNDVSLEDYVNQLVGTAGLGLRVFERDGGALYQDLADALCGGYRDLGDLIVDLNCSHELREWAVELDKKGERLRRQWPRFAKYLCEGTIEWLAGRDTD